MFRTLPPTPQAIQARADLLAMMEDKYTELRNEGMPEHQAVAQVISDFGNLEEVAQDKTFLPNRFPRALPGRPSCRWTQPPRASSWRTGANAQARLRSELFWRPQEVAPGNLDHAVRSGHRAVL